MITYVNSYFHFFSFNFIIFFFIKYNDITAKYISQIITYSTRTELSPLSHQSPNIATLNRVNPYPKNGVHSKYTILSPIFKVA